jgi:response regulator RpfG family c-di-GMP phosphodiesterase
VIDKDIVILVAEDDYGHYTLTKKLIRNANIKNEIVHFYDDNEFLKFLNNSLFRIESETLKCILILDVNMPRAEGIEVLSYMKQNNLLDRIPTIMMSCINDKEINNECSKLGSKGFIEKPAGPNLIKSITEIAKVFSSAN